MKSHFITYGDDKYREQRKLLKKTALESSFFDEVRIFNPSAIEPVFSKCFRSVLTLEKGGGYWIWKPYLIKKTLDELPDDDVLIYADAGCLINKNGKQRYLEYLALLKETETGTIAFQLPQKENEFTKREVFDYFEAPEELINSAQLTAAVILLRKCSHTTLLVNQWYDTLYENLFLFTDEKDDTIQYPAFIDHCHDQSIFSVIRKMHGALVLPDETSFQDFGKDGKPYPFWTTQ